MRRDAQLFVGRVQPHQDLVSSPGATAAYGASSGKARAAAARSASATAVSTALRWGAAQQPAPVPSANM